MYSIGLKAACDASATGEQAAHTNKILQNKCIYIVKERWKRLDYCVGAPLLGKLLTYINRLVVSAFASY